MENLLISIIIPVFNLEEYIAECIESIQNQTYQNLQIILVDDGSTDCSGIICDKYALKDSRIEVVHQCNKGPVSARKKGIEKARGKYIGFIDGDDFIEPDMYQILVQEIEKNKVDFVHSGYWKSNVKVRCTSELIELTGNRKEFLKNILLEKGNYITPSNFSKLFKAELIKKSYDCVNINCSLGEDLLALCICILESKKISIIEGCYYHYRLRECSLSHKKDISDIKKIYILYEDLCDIFRSYGLYNEMETILDQFLWNNLLFYMSRINQNSFQLEKYYFRDIGKLLGKRVIIYGAGMVGRDYYSQISRYSDCKVTAWVDAHPEKYQYKHINLWGVDILDSIEFDILLIAVLRETTANDICNELIKRGISREKIYWSSPGKWGMESPFIEEI